MSADYKIVDGLVAKVLFGANITDNKQNMYLPASVQEGAPYGGIGQVGSFFTVNWLNENTLSYNKKIGKVHSIGAVVGYTQQESVTTSAIAGASGFPSDATTYNALQNGTQQSVVVSGYASSPASGQSKWVLESFLARVNYGYKDKYLLTLTTRADGSSKFSAGHKWGTFPSAAVAWNASNEDFVKQFKAISLLKFRFSAGITGNQQIPPYQSLAQMTYERYNFGNTTVAGFAPTNIYNPNLTWEKTTQYNFGVDLGLFNNRISVVADIYLKKTRDLLLNLTIPSQTGVLNYTSTVLQDQAYENAGSMENKGFELALLTQNIVGKKFKWNTTLVYSENRNKITSLASGLNQLVPNTALPSVAAVGYSAGSFLVYQTDGLVAAGTSLKDASAVTINAPADPNNKTLALAGQQKYKDIDGDGKITANDRIVINNQPKFIAGLTNTFSYASKFGTVDLTIFFQTVYGNKIFNQNASVLGVGTGYQNASGNYLEYYTAGRTNTDIAAPFPNPAPTTSSSRYIEDGSYVRLKNLTLGYSLPTTLLEKARIKSIRIYVSAQNLVTWTKYTGFDPEVSSNDQSGINMGVDLGSYPNIKTVLGGLQLSF
jgi:TonB-linked SusC/RagA family outer membrane protein